MRVASANPIDYKRRANEAVRDGKLVIPISQKLPLSAAAQVQAAAEKGGIGRILNSMPTCNAQRDNRKMKKDHRRFNLASKPSGNGCVECLASAQGWWLHLRRCAECGHIGYRASGHNQL